LRLLRRRFNLVPLTVEHQMQAASIAQLDTWMDAAFDAPSLEAVFGGPVQGDRKTGDGTT